MSGVYTRRLTLRAEHVDFTRRCRLSVLMRLFQECCIAHTEELGMGRDKTLDRGLLWIVNSENIEIARLPEYDEEITLVCRPGRTLHFFFPRHMSVTDKGGREIVKISAMWSLIDSSTRQMADPAERGIVIEGDQKDGDLPPVMSLPAMTLPAREVLTARYSETDINGHLNNASYLDAALDLLPTDEISSLCPSSVKCVFKKEIPLGSRFEVAYGRDGAGYHFRSEHFSIDIS